MGSKAPRLKRLSPSMISRRKTSESLQGHVVLPETRAKISSSMKGVPKSPEHRAKIAEARRNRPPKTVEGTISAGRRVTKRRWGRVNAWRWRLWRKDMRIAREIGDMALHADVKASYGYAYRRRLQDPTGRVSEGASLAKYGKVR